MAGNGYNGRYKAQQFINAIPGTGGIITTIAKRVGCDWHTAKKYVTEYATVKAAYNAECESVLDAAESVILSEIMDKEVQTAKWYLTMKGSERGYAERKRYDVNVGDIDAAIERELARVAGKGKDTLPGAIEGDPGS